MASERRPLYEYCLPHLTEARRLLSDILEKQSQLYNFWSPGSKFYNYVKFLFDTVSNSHDAINTTRYNSLINFLDINAAAGLFSSSFDSAARDNLTEQILLLYLAFGGEVVGMEPYNSDEIGLILDGKFDYYSDEVMAHTLSKLWMDGSDEIEVNAMFRVLTPVVDNYRPWNNIDRVSGLIEVLVSHNLWSAWFGLSEVQRRQLLHDYFYLSIVAGVPVLEWFKVYAKSAPADEKVLEKISGEIINNNETMPPFGGKEEVKFIDILKRYAAGSGGIGGFEQEKFLDDLFRGEKRKGPYSQWLRQAFGALRFLDAKNG